MVNRERAIDYLNTREKLFVFDGFAGWDPKYRIKVCEKKKAASTAAKQQCELPSESSNNPEATTTEKKN